MMLCMSAQAGWSQDSGRIAQLFATPDGAIAIALDNGFPNAIAAQQCPAGDGQWAGVATSNAAFKGALMLAKSAGSQIVVTTLGCEGSWLKIIDVYVK